MTRLARLPAVLLFVGVVFGVLRIPHAVWNKRLGEIAEYRRLGAPGFHLRLIDRTGASARWLQWLLEHTPPDCALLHRGEEKGAFEFAAPILFPRLLVGARAVTPEATGYAGRRLATGQPPGAEARGTLVLVAGSRSLSVEVRR